MTRGCDDATRAAGPTDDTHLPEWAIAVYAREPRRLLAVIDVRDGDAVTRDVAAEELLQALLGDA